MNWRPRADTGAARTRARMLGNARRYFADTDAMEVDVPAISSAAVSDPNIDSVRLTLDIEPGAPRFLHTSPEYAMKRLLAAGYPDIYFLGKVFRDGEAGRRHQPEFTMAEWYRHGFGLSEIMHDAEQFILRTLDQLMLQTDAIRVSYRDAMQQALGHDPYTTHTDELAELAGADDSLRHALGDDRDAWLDLLMATRVAPGFPNDRLTTVFHYPASQAALARLGEDASVAERFEIFLGDVELANGYVELTDADEQRRRFTEDLEKRAQRGAATRPVDELLLAALEAGLPDCAGVAVGFDRLVMLNAGCDDIRDVLTFPFEPTT